MVDYKYFYIKATDFKVIQNCMDKYSSEGYLLTYINNTGDYVIILFEKELKGNQVAN